MPIITADQLTEADGIIFGIPTRFGSCPAQMKALLDSTGKLWATGALAGKFAGTFFSTASQHGGKLILHACLNFETQYHHLE